MRQVESSPNSAQDQIYDLPNKKFIWDHRFLHKYDREAMQDFLNVRKRVEFAFRDFDWAMTLPMYVQPTQLACSARQDRFVGILRIATSGNPVPGEGYSIEKARALLAMAQETKWIPDNMNGQIEALRAQFSASLQD